MAYTAPAQVPYAPLTTTGSAGRPLPITQFLQDSVGSSSVVAAPGAGTPIVQLGAGVLPQGAYAITATVCFMGSTAETNPNNVRLAVGSTVIMPLLTPTAVGTPVSTTLILTLSGTDFLRLESVGAATASTSYSGQLVATRIK